MKIPVAYIVCVKKLRHKMAPANALESISRPVGFGVVTRKSADNDKIGLLPTPGCLGLFCQVETFPALVLQGFGFDKFVCAF